MGIVRHFFILILCWLCAIACSRPLNKDSSRLSIRAPGHPGQLGKAEAGSLSTIPTNRKACYGVSVSGQGIPGTAGTTCSPKSGVVAGFVEPNGLLELNVPQGTGRKVDLYLFLMKPGETGPCPQMAGAFSAAQLLQTYFMGDAPNVSLSKEVEVVTIKATFPGVNNYLARQNELPASCTAGVPQIPNPSGFHVSSSYQVSTDGANTIQLKGRVGMPNSGTTLSNAEYILKVK